MLVVFSFNFLIFFSVISDDKTIQRLDWDPTLETYVTKMKLTGHEGGIICMQFDGMYD